MSDLFGEYQEDADQARDFALRKVRENGGEWHATALLALNLIPGFVGTGEEIRIRLQLAAFERGLWTYDGEPAGSGYCALRRLDEIGDLS